VEELTSPPDQVHFSIPVDDDLRRRFDSYVAASGYGHSLLATRLFNSALRGFLNTYAPIQYPFITQEK
jgi:hypothetical protein